MSRANSFLVLRLHLSSDLSPRVGIQSFTYPPYIRYTITFLESSVPGIQGNGGWSQMLIYRINKTCTCRDANLTSTVVRCDQSDVTGISDLDIRSNNLKA